MKKKAIIALAKTAMRITLTQLCFLFVFSYVSFATDGKAQGVLDAEISIKANQKEIKTILSNLQQNYSIPFIYSPDAIQADRKMSLDLQSKKLSYFLEKMLQPLGISYKVINEKILLYNPGNTDLNLDNEYAAMSLAVTVKGKVTDENNAPLPGVSILAKGTTSGTTTDVNGNFVLSVPDNANILVFSFLGYLKLEIELNNRDIINVKLVPDTKGLQEVVITALGIKREVRSLGYATSTVTKEQITENRTPQVFGTLQGKLSGVNITLPSTGPAGSTKIRIRGQSSFSGSNTPLIVIDGMPMDNTNFGTRKTSAADGGDGLSSINPDIIETMTVLKGAAASALYGSRAKDGVIMITTKKTGTAMGLGVEYNANYTMETPLDFTDFQYEYGQGERGIRPTAAWPTSGTWSFGEKFQPGMTQVLFDNVTVPYEPVFNRYKKFYNVGQNLTNTVTLSNRSDKGGFSAAFTTTEFLGTVPGSKFKRKQISLGLVQNISKNLSIDGSIQYSNEDNINPPNALNIYSLQIPGSVNTVSNSMPFDLLEKYAFDEQGNELVWGRFLPRTNPYFAIAKKFENISRDRLLGNMSVKYQFTDWLFIQGRIAQDFYIRNQDYNIPTGYLGQRSQAPPGFSDGSYTQEASKFRETNLDFLIGINRKFGDFSVNTNLGGNQMSRRSDYNSASVQDFIQRGLYTIGNGRILDAVFDLNERAVNSFYGTAEIAFRDYLYVNVTGRNDWFSTLSPNNRSIFYPSITTSFVFSDALKSTMPDWLSFGKLRLGYAQVGDDNVAAYSNQLYYQVNPFLFPNPAGAMIPVGNVRGNVIPNDDLRPLLVSEIEAGADLRLFNNAIGLDFSLYRKISEDQIVSAQISNTTSFNSRLINVGRSMNKGIEVDFRATPVRTNSFSWNVAFNTSYNISEVLQLGENAADSVITIGSVRQVVGKPLGQIYQFLQKRDANGNLVFSKNSGFPVRGQFTNVGTNQPNWFGGITNSFNIKGIMLSTLITYKLGKNYIMLGGSNSDYVRHGLSKLTLPGREVGYVIGNGVNEDGNVNTTKANVQPYYEALNSNVADQYITNGGYWKFAQASLSYDFSKLLPSRLFIKGLRFSIVGNNIATLKRWTVNMDPDELGNNLGDNSNGSGRSGVPLTRGVGFNLNLKF